MNGNVAYSNLIKLQKVGAGSMVMRSIIRCAVNMCTFDFYNFLLLENFATAISKSSPLLCSNHSQPILHVSSRTQSQSHQRVKLISINGEISRRDILPFVSAE